MIYVIESPTQKAIKIGYVQDLETIELTLAKLKVRQSSIQVGNPAKLCLTGLIKGNYTEEQELHKQFIAYRLEGEWFSNCYEVMSILRGMFNEDLWEAYKSPKDTPEYASEFEKLENGRYQVSFKRLAEEYANLRDSKVVNSKALKRLELAETRYPWLKEAYEKLGADTFKRLRYVKEAIQKEANKLEAENETVYAQVIAMLQLEEGKRYTSKYIKKRLKEASKSIPGVPGTASGISKYYKVTPARWMEKGRKIVGYTVQKTLFP